ncbi:MAG: hypothetical protein JWO33_1748 [Caulobacteraceae bacterium]|nr:hypothetical protein [Caulobacteraceae bacterium]
MRIKTGLGRMAATAIMVATMGCPVWAAGLRETDIRAFVAAQQQAWNGRATDAYFALFQPDAMFADQYRTPDGQVVPYGRSTLAEARSQTRRSLAKSRSTEMGEIVRITPTADGRSAVVISRVTSRQESAGRVRVSCAERTQTLSLEQGRIRSSGQSDTFMRCPR